jgi:nucleotide-binding universal stress UspA family protein
MLWAAAHASSRGAELLLVHAIGAPVPGIGDAWDEAVRDGVTAMLEREAARVSREYPELKVRTEIGFDTPARSLVRYSSTAELVVVGTRRTAEERTVRARSRAYQVVAGAHCSVAVVPPTSGPVDNRVVVGVDGSPDSLAAARIASAEADSVGADLVVLHAWSEPAFFGEMTWPPAGLWEAIRDEGARVLAEASAGLQSDFPDLVVERALRESEPTAALLAAADRARLLVVGSRGLHGPARAMLGSTSHDVVLHAPCPVLVARC